MMTKKISVIISAYNEESTIKGVISEVLNSNEVSELIVTNDGSSDKTAEIVRHFLKDPRLKFIDFPENRGKGYAMAEGIIKAKGNILVFVDADLINFSHIYINELVAPLLSGEADMVIGHPAESRIDAFFNPFKSLAGERAVFKKDILPIVERIRYSGFGVETAINLYFKAQRKKVKCVILWNLKHPVKLQKTSLPKAAQGYASETFQIGRTLLLHYAMVWKAVENNIRVRL